LSGEILGRFNVVGAGKLWRQVPVLPYMSFRNFSLPESTVSGTQPAAFKFFPITGALEGTGTSGLVKSMRREMGNTGKQLIASREEDAFLDLLRTCDLLSRGLAHLLKSQDISPTQYNVLRILRGSPAGLPCGEIASRMITRDPDVTRLLDRLEGRGLISRSRDAKDRRAVVARITPEGLKLLERLDEPIQEGHRKQLGHLGRERLSALTELLAAARGNVE
jgi:DNA-binding MarR family transcriptional regulator